MKHLLVLASGVLLSVASSLSLAGPAEPGTWFAGGMLGKSTLDIGASWGLTVLTDPDWTPADNPYCEVDPEACKPEKDVLYQDGDSEAFMLGALGGYNIYDWLAVEGQFVGNMLSDDILGQEMTVDMSAMGVYAVYQKGGDVFLKVRLGFGRSTAEFTSTDASVSQSSVYASWGLSVGQKIGPGSVEFMYMRYPDVKMDRVAFKETFDGGDGAVIKRDLTFETLTVAYIYTF